MDTLQVVKELLQLAWTLGRWRKCRPRSGTSWPASVSSHPEPFLQSAPWRIWRWQEITLNPWPRLRPLRRTVRQTWKKKELRTWRKRPRMSSGQPGGTWWCWETAWSSSRVVAVSQQLRQILDQAVGRGADGADSALTCITSIPASLLTCSLKLSRSILVQGPHFLWKNFSGVLQKSKGMLNSFTSILHNLCPIVLPYSPIVYWSFKFT
jgi:hypothetical protein